MTIDNKQLSDLLKRDTYAGMSDEEIDAIIKHYSEQAANETLYKMREDAIIKHNEAMVAEYNTRAKEAQARLDVLLEKPLELVEVVQE